MSNSSVGCWVLAQALVGSRNSFLQSTFWKGSCVPDPSTVLRALGVSLEESISSQGSFPFASVCQPCACVTAVTVREKLIMQAENEVGCPVHMNFTLRGEDRKMVTGCDYEGKFPNPL